MSNEMRHTYSYHGGISSSIVYQNAVGNKEFLLRGTGLATEFFFFFF